MSEMKLSDIKMVRVFREEQKEYIFTPLRDGRVIGIGNGHITMINPKNDFKIEFSIKPDTTERLVGGFQMDNGKFVTFQDYKAIIWDVENEHEYSYIIQDKAQKDVQWKLEDLDDQIEGKPNIFREKIIDIRNNIPEIYIGLPNNRAGLVYSSWHVNMNLEIFSLDPFSHITTLKNPDRINKMYLFKKRNLLAIIFDGGINFWSATTYENITTLTIDKFECNELIECNDKFYASYRNCLLIINADTFAIEDTIEGSFGEMTHLRGDYIFCCQDTFRLFNCKTKTYEEDKKAETRFFLHPINDKYFLISNYNKLEIYEY